MKTIRTIRQVVERDEYVSEAPQFKIGDCVEIYSGTFEGHCFWIKDVRYNHDLERFEYLYGGVMGGWYGEKNITIVKRKISQESP